MNQLDLLQLLPLKDLFTFFKLIIDTGLFLEVFPISVAQVSAIAADIEDKNK